MTYTLDFGIVVDSMAVMAVNNFPCKLSSLLQYNLANGPNHYLPWSVRFESNVFGFEYADAM